MEQNFVTIPREIAEMALEFAEYHSKFWNGESAHPVNFVSALRVALRQTHSLSHADLQVIRNLLSLRIRGSQQICDYNKAMIDICSRRCDPDNPDTKVDFKQMNHFKNMLRKDKKQRDKLAAIQHKFKKLI